MNLSSDPKVWEYFELRLCKGGKKLARCDICAKIFEFLASSTSDLRSHLLATHQINLPEMEASSESSTKVYVVSDGNDQESIEHKDGKPEVGENKDGKQTDGENEDGNQTDGENKDGNPENGEKNDGKSVEVEHKDYNGDTSEVNSVEGNKDDTRDKDGKSLDDENKEDKSVSGDPKDDKPVNGDPKDGKSVDGEVREGKVDNEEQGKPTKSWLKSAQSMCKLYNKTFRVAEMAEKMEEGGDQSMTSEEIQESLVKITKFLMGHRDGNLEMMSFENILEYLESRGHLNISTTDTDFSTNNMPNWMKLADGMCKKYGRRFRMAEVANSIPDSDGKTVTPVEVWEGITKVGKVLTRNEEGCYQQIMALEKIVQYVDSKTSQ